jgi:hypothetical protein
MAIQRINGYANQYPRMQKGNSACQHKARMCPLTAGIFIRIISEVALEKMSAGDMHVSPFWRVVDPKSPLARKISCGPETIIKLRASEAGEP